MFSRPGRRYQPKEYSSSRQKQLLHIEALGERALLATFAGVLHPADQELRPGPRPFFKARMDATDASKAIAVSMAIPAASVAPFSNASATINLPRGTAPAGGWPVVFLFNGDGMGAVGGGAQAANLSNALLKQGVATAVVTYPNLVSVDAFEKSIVAVLQNAANGRLAEARRINPHAFGVAGFSAGGFISTFLLAKYAHGYGYDLQGGVSYYGFADLNTWFAYHRSEAKGIMPTDPTLAGGNDPNAICYTPHGLTRCRDHSAELLAAVGAHIAGPSAGKLESFSTTDVISHLVAQGQGGQVAPIYGVFGSNDPNIIPAINERQIQSLWSQAGAEYHYVTYNGTHGAEWTVSPDAVNWLVGRLASGANPSG